MATLNGYIKLHRKMVEWGWYSDSVVKDVFLHLLMTATYKDKEYLGHKLHSGQAVVGRKKLAKELGFSEQQIRTALKKLESTGEISIKSTNRFTIVTVENWASYQLEGELSNQQSTNNQPTDNQQITNNQPRLKNVKKEKNDKNINNNNIIPPAREDVERYCRERGNHVDVDRFMSHYESNGWKVGRNAMKDWKAAVRTWEKSSFGGNEYGQGKQPVSAEGSRRGLGIYL